MAEADLFWAIIGVLLMVFGATGMFVLFSDLIKSRRRKRIAVPPPHILDELEQNFAWWDRQYWALMAECFEIVPFDPAQHEGHSHVTVLTYGNAWRVEECTDCPVEYRPKQLFYQR